MKRSEIKIIPDYFKRYVELIPGDMSIMTALDTFGGTYMFQEIPKYKSLGNKVYASNKWTIKQILAHLVDTERIFAYRALRFARGDKNPLAGMEQDDYVAESYAASRSIDDLFVEFKSLRESTIQLYSSFDDRLLQRYGPASGMDVSVLALGFMICGHLVHHQKVLERLYYPLLNQ